MVRPQIYRQKKYEAKVDPDVIRARFTAVKELMAEQTTAKFTDLATMEQNIKSILEPLGVPSIQIPFYLNFGRELYRITQKFTGATLQQEAKVKYDKWKSRGLDPEKLKAIAESFGIDTSDW